MTLGSGTIVPGDSESPAEAALRMVLENAPIVSWGIDADGRITDSSGAGLAVLGLSPGETDGASIFDLYGDQPDVVEHIHRGLAGETFRTTARIGSLVFDTRYLPIRDEQGRVVGLRGVSTVITERVRLAEALERTERQLVEAYRSMPVGIVISRIEDGRIIEVSDEFARMSGRSREAILGRTTAELDMWADPAERADFGRRLAEGTPVRDQDYRFRRPNGEIAIGRVSADRIEIGGEACLVAIARDVTELRRTEEAARLAEERFHTLARLAPAGISQTDATGQNNFVNDYLTKLTGLTPEEIAGTGWTRCIHEEDLPQVLAKWGAAVAAGSEWEGEFRIRTTSGEIRWLFGRSVPVRDAEGRVTSHIGTVIDVTRAKTAELELLQHRAALETRVRERTAELEWLNASLEAEIIERQRMFDELRTSQEYWQSIIENVQDYIMRVDADGTIQAINRTRPDMSKDQVEGSTVFDFIPHESLEHAHAVVRRVFETGEPADDEIQTIGPGGQIQWFASRLGPIRRDGQVVAVTVVSRDITRQKLAENEELERQAQLDHMSRAATLGTMVAEMAHEVYTPLDVISRYAEGCLIRLRKQTDEAIPGEPLAAVVDALERIVEQSRRSSQTIEGIKDLLRRRTPELKPIDFNAAVRTAAALLQVKFEKSSVRLSLSLADDLPPVLADETHLLQIVVNLIVNAIEAMENEPFESRRLDVRTESDGSEIRLAVRDCGCGVAADQIEKVFEKFHTTKPRGLGLGLAICRNIVTSYGGRIECVPNDEQGVTMHVRIPVDEGDCHDA